MSKAQPKKRQTFDDSCVYLNKLQVCAALIEIRENLEQEVDRQLECVREKNGTLKTLSHLRKQVKKQIRWLAAIERAGAVIAKVVASDLPPTGRFQIWKGRHRVFVGKKEAREITQ
jgi:transposase-like protein